MANHQAVSFGSPKSDHYTTPREAFADLEQYKPIDLIRIYDPFFNDGKASQYLKSTFPDCEIIHENKDAFSWCPVFDMIITNPPFSIKDRVLKWLMEMDKPFMVLLPVNHMCNKGFKKMKNFDKIQFIVPNGRYNFEFDGNHKSGCWFNVMWYCYKCHLVNQINYITA